MKLKCGIDAARISRLTHVNPKIKKRFVQRVYTEREQAQARGRDDALASLFAAKEAASKALGTGIGRVSWRDIEVLHRPTGEPRIKLHGVAKKVAKLKRLTKWAVSITHEGDFAIASVVALGGKSKK
ncbi:MAG: holo-ACP synthase [Anaerolineaceae bacterium]